MTGTLRLPLPRMAGRGAGGSSPWGRRSTRRSTRGGTPSRLDWALVDEDRGAAAMLDTTWHAE
eukprot:2650964-Alexandrium_andersonii.AAC.1